MGYGRGNLEIVITVSTRDVVEERRQALENDFIDSEEQDKSDNKDK